MLSLATTELNLDRTKVVAGGAFCTPRLPTTLFADVSDFVDTLHRQRGTSGRPSNRYSGRSVCSRPWPAVGPPVPMDASPPGCGRAAASMATPQGPMGCPLPRPRGTVGMPVGRGSMPLPGSVPPQGWKCCAGLLPLTRSASVVMLYVNNDNNSRRAALFPVPCRTARDGVLVSIAVYGRCLHGDFCCRCSLQNP